MDYVRSFRKVLNKASQGARQVVQLRGIPLLRREESHHHMTELLPCVKVALERLSWLRRNPSERRALEHEPEMVREEMVRAVTCLESIVQFYVRDSMPSAAR